MSYSKVKAIIDPGVAALMLLLLWPFLLILALIIKCSSKGPIFFKQKRVGKNKEYFYILKFRTMKVDAPKEMPTHLLEDPDQYITAIGRFMRKTSLDELPQLINILLTQMSFVGPRPALWNQYDLIEARDLYKANDLRPGLTGWAQVNGRDELSIPLKAKLDGEYVNRVAFFFDLRIILMTMGRVLNSHGVQEGAAKQK